MLTGAVVVKYQHPQAVYGLAYRPQRDLLATTCNDHVLRLWDVRAPILAMECLGHDNSILGVNFSSDGRLLVSSSTERLWDVRMGHTLRTLRGHKDYVRGCAFSGFGNTLATTSNDKTVSIVAGITPLPLTI